MRAPLHIPSFSDCAARYAATLLLAAVLGGNLFAAPVGDQTARTVAWRFLAAHTAVFGQLQEADLTLAYTAQDAAFGQQPAEVYFRVYNAGEQGFVIISADDAVIPILGYSTESSFNPDGIPENAAKWLEGYKQEIRATMHANTTAGTEVAAAWHKWQSAMPGSDRDGQSVDPLLQTTWNQQPYVNALCPGGSLSGCVATAMAQVMKYHNWPVTGEGFHSYDTPDYGTLSANFAGTTYDWASMTNTATSPNAAIATLMFHCGVSVNMQYSPDNSGAYVTSDYSPIQNCAEYALKTYFGYSNSLQGIERANYSESQWINTLKGEMDASRPVIYAGQGTGGGHCFVCDGYDDNNYFHFNWGWGGYYDGYFAVGALNPEGVGDGGGSGGYNDYQQAIIGIQPDNGGGGGGGNTASDLVLYDNVTPSATTLNYGQAFNVSTNILNNAATDFSGDYAAAIFDAGNNFYGYVQELDGYTLPAGYTYTDNLVFSSTGLFSMLPGTYYVAILYRATGNAEWSLVGDNGGYTNLPQITVVNPNDMELNSAMTLTPGTTVAQGSQLSVNLNLVNNGASTFYGQYEVALYNISDGTLAQDVGTYDETAGLPSGYTYLAPFLTFGPATVTVDPGTYLLAVQHNPGDTGWQLTGSTNYPNPIFVNVVAPGISPDQYEVDDAVSQAYSLPVSFIADAASTNTTGSNLHNGTDQDYYKVVLPAGNNYAITARLNDSYNSGNGNTYTVDGLWSWSTDGTTWSPAYDDVMPGDIVVNGGGTVWFHVAPYFAGNTGTYLLQLDMQRGTNVGIGEEAANNGIRLFPNPARDAITVDMAGAAAHLKGIELFDLSGRQMHIPGPGHLADGSYRLDVSGLGEGVYLLRMTTDQGVRTERIVIAR